MPRYGTLRFLDRSGRPGNPISVGYEWTYRGYFEGGTLAAAIWTFQDVTPENYPLGLPLELNIRVFRTHKGKIERGIIGSIVLRNPNPAKQKQSPPILFTAREFEPELRIIPRTFRLPPKADGQAAEMDIFQELVDDGRIEVMIRCEERAQYFGVAQADVYLRAPDSQFYRNFIKACVSIWLQMLLVTSFGVMFSTFLSGAVAMIATLSSIVMGFLTRFILNLAISVMRGEEFLDRADYIEGGGPIESMYRIITQMNVTLDLEPGVVTTIMQTIDRLLMFCMWAAASLLPNYADFSNADYVAYGYNIQFDLWSQQCVITLVYIAAVTCLGYFLLKTREIAA